MDRVVQKQATEVSRLYYHYAASSLLNQPTIRIKYRIGNKLNVSGLAMQKHTVVYLDFLS